jgi:hypothetical protein
MDSRVASGAADPGQCFFGREAGPSGEGRLNPHRAEFDFSRSRPSKLTGNARAPRREERGPRKCGT